VFGKGSKTGGSGEPTAVVLTTTVGVDVFRVMLGDTGSGGRRKKAFCMCLWSASIKKGKKRGKEKREGKERRRGGGKEEEKGRRGKERRV